MQVTDLINQGRAMVEQNAPVILTGVGVVGTITTAVLTGRATVKAVRLLEEEEAIRFDGTDPTWSKKDQFLIVAPKFIPPVASGGTTIAAIIMANRISSKRAAVMAGAYALSERAFQEYKEKAAEKLGKSKEDKVREELAQDRVNQSPPGGHIIIAGSEVLCQDGLTGRYFSSSVEKIKRRENELNEELINRDYASVSWFFDPLGLPATSITDTLGWRNTNGLVDLNLSTVITPDQRPCIVIDFSITPHPDYHKLY